MKNKITLIILLIIVLILASLAFFFGYKYLSDKNNISSMSSQIEELNTQINDLNSKNEELSNQLESNNEEEQSQESSNNSINVKVYYNDNNTLVLYLIENSNPQNVPNSRLTDVDNRYILAYRTNNALIDEITGYFYKENGTIKLNVLDHDTSLATLFDATVDENTKNGTTNLVGTYDGQNIIFGTETLVIK